MFRRENARKGSAGPPFVEELCAGGGGFYGEWMKDPHSAMVSCNDGFRPVTFHLEAVDN